MTPPAPAAFLPACIGRPAELPWMPSAAPGKAAKLLHVLPGDAGFVELLRMEPGVKMPLHRHAGEVHAWNLSGSRVLCTGETIGPGEYVYEPPGNTDWWQAVGGEPLVVFVVVMGEVAFLGEDGAVLTRVSAATLRRDWEAFLLQQEQATAALRPAAPCRAD
jgi:quercetin dioxygenase-like cupin family protein